MHPIDTAGAPSALDTKQIEAGWRDTFSTDNPFCPCNLKSFTKAVRWAERQFVALAAPGEPVYAECYVCGRPMDGKSEDDCHCFHRRELAAPVPSAAPGERPETFKHWCETCEGLGTIDETLGGEHFSNPKAKCPDCDGHGYWISSAAPGERAPSGYKLVIVPDELAPDEPDWEECKRQAEVATGLKVEQHTFSILKREVRRWIAHRNAASPALQAEPVYQRAQDEFCTYWRDVTKDEWDRVGTIWRRIVFTHPAPASAPPALHAAPTDAQIEAAFRDVWGVTMIEVHHMHFARAVLALATPAQAAAVPEAVEPSPALQAEPIAWALRWPGDSRINLSTVFDTELEAKEYAERCDSVSVVPLYILAAPGKPQGAYAEVQAERARQDAQWGGPSHDDEHDPVDWEGFIEYQAYWGREQDPRRRFVKIAALAIAAIESIGRKSQGKPQGAQS